MSRSETDDRLLYPSLSARAIAFAEAAEYIETVDDLITLFVKELEYCGLQYFTSFELPAIIASAQSDDGKEWINTFPQDFLDHYTDENYIARDPAMRMAGIETRPFTWSQITDKGGLAPRDMAIMRAPKAFGIGEGFVIPLHGPNGYIGVVTLCGEAFEGHPSEKRALHFMAIHLHERIKDLQGRDWDLLEIEAPLLTPRERECLLWVAMGKSDWDIGEILGIAQSTAHEHIERAKRKLGVSTRVQAVVQAMKKGEIRP